MRRLGSLSVRDRYRVGAAASLLAALLGASLFMAPSAFAHHPTVSGTTACDVPGFEATFTSVSWQQTGGDDTGSANPHVEIYSRFRPGAAGSPTPWVAVPWQSSYHYVAANNFQFSDTIVVPDLSKGDRIQFQARAVAPWGNNSPGGQTTESDFITFPTNCDPPTTTVPPPPITAPPTTAPPTTAPPTTGPPTTAPPTTTTTALVPVTTTTSLPDQTTTSLPDQTTTTAVPCLEPTTTVLSGATTSSTTPGPVTTTVAPCSTTTTTEPELRLSTSESTVRGATVLGESDTNTPVGPAVAAESSPMVTVGGALPTTGVNTFGMVLVAVALLAAGFCMVQASRPTRRSR